jgi:hypothetical protein
MRASEDVRVAVGLTLQFMCGLLAVAVSAVTSSASALVAAILVSKAVPDNLRSEAVALTSDVVLVCFWVAVSAFSTKAALGLIAKLGRAETC